MATACSNNDLNDFVTCGVCLTLFDDQLRRPKFLPCSHTICCLCLEEIWNFGKITCPFCRNNSMHVDCQSIPNNNYALHMLKLEKMKVEKTDNSTNSMGVNWCFTCGSVAKTFCTSFEHSLVIMTTETIKNLEAFVRLKEELQKIKNQSVDKLAMAIEKRKQVEKHLDHLIKAVKATIDEIHQLQDENNLLMAELVSMLERGVHKPVDETNSSFETKDYFLSELKSLTDDSSPDDTAETLKEKLIKLVEMSEEKLREAEAAALEFDNFQKMKITVNLTDEENHPLPTVPWLQNGFQLLKVDGSDGLRGTGRPIRKDLTLLSHVIFSLIRRHRAASNESMVCPAIPSVSNVSSPQPQPNLFSWELDEMLSNHTETSLSTKSFPDIHTSPSRLGISFPCTPVTIPPTVPAARNFVVGRSKFILKLYKSGVLQGKILISPVPSFHPEFIQLLGDFCYQSPKIFSQSISKAVTDVFVLFSMAHSEFKPAVPAMIQSFASPFSNKACRPDEIGVNLVTTTKCGSMISGWSFIFPLQNFTAPKYAMHVKNLAAAKLFGHVVYQQMLEPITKLGSLSSAARVGYTITLESGF